MDWGAANSAAASFPSGPARVHRSGIPTHVRCLRRRRDAATDHLGRLERRSKIRRARWCGGVELDSRWPVDGGRGDERLDRGPELSQLEYLSDRSRHARRAQTYGTEWSVDVTSDLTRWAAHRLHRLSGD